MRTDIRELSEGAGLGAIHRGRSAMARHRASDNSGDLEPLAVDAVFADESTPMLQDSGDRRDSHHRHDAYPIALHGSGVADDQLLRSLSTQLELLNQQQHEIRRLLDQAGRRRVDRIIK
ncbi:hypothetical protein [Lacipirellula limnantheis]|uniref:Uncharacterized protein n=1 Tax=Lacipirellula limnantheis TaxID=2528024 RepID=A0A517U097_9BACT|nr:hypothetical protein [Lacipirellula limnantheis]QDT74058.1 hypothetical protein I41_32520 [Lacipirellula limnantheis]